MNKHIQIRLKSIQCLFGKVVLLDFVKSEKNIVDSLTKGLSRSMVLESSREMSLTYLIRSWFHERGSMW